MYKKTNRGRPSFISNALRRFGWLMAMLLGAAPGFAQRGAFVPWITYEAENMTISGGTVVTNGGYSQNNVAAESSGRACVQLNNTGQYIQFTAQGAANAIVVRYSVPDSSGGGGANYTLSLYVNGTFVQELPMTSMYSWLYGAYQFVNTPSSGSPRNFYDEVRQIGLTINPGDVIRLEKNSGDTAAFYDIDLVDLENVAAPLTQPANSLNITNYGGVGDGVTDCTTALQNCINAGNALGMTIWIPAGNYAIAGNINLPSNTTVQGAGMWYTKLIGNASVYNSTPSQRVSLNGNGSNIHLSDFAILGYLDHRNNGDNGDGLNGSFGTGSSISRLWVEHTKTAAWIVNSSGLVVDGCRFRNTLADGINLNTGMQGTIVTNCTTRGTGDDCFAIWPSANGNYAAGNNVITHCTGELSWLANGAGIYGGANNVVEDSLFQDQTYQCGILISTFPVGSGANFSGTTVVQDCDVIRDGGASGLQITMDLTSISGLNINNLNISNSISSGMNIVNTVSGVSLSDAVMSYVSIPNDNLAGGGYGLWAENGAMGSMTVSNCTLVDTVDSSSSFTFNVVNTPQSETVGTSPAGLNFTVDGTNYTTPQSFNWVPGSNHTLATTGTQSGGTGTQYVWSAWSDGGALSHSIAAASGATYTADFTTQYYLTMNAGANGGVSPASLWTNNAANVSISATPAGGYGFANWTGSGSGSYSGNNNPALVTMNGPITEIAAFATASKIISLSGDLAFGDVPVGSSSGLTMTIGNTGNTTLTVNNINYPNGFSGKWSGTVPPGGSTNVTVTFSPASPTNYSGNLTVNSDATSGANTLGLSGTGIPVAQNTNQTNVTVIATLPWQGYLVTTDTNGVQQPAETYGVANIANLRASFVPAPPTRLLLQINTNTYDAGGADVFDNANGTPKLVEQNLLYVDVGTNYDGLFVNFSGTVESNSLPAGWTAYAFVEEWLPGYAGVKSETTMPLVGGQPFNLTSPNAVLAGDIAQYGFYVYGPNTAPNSASSKQAVSIVVNNPGVPTTNVTVNPAQNWIGYLTYDNINGGAYEGGYGSALSNLPAAFRPSQADATTLVLGINTNTWDAGGADVFDNANGTPATTLELDTYVDVGTSFAGDQVNFQGTVQSNSLPAGWTANAFIKEWTSGYGSEVAAPVTALEAGQPFALNRTIGSGHIAQYGFHVLGPNTAPNSAAAQDTVSILVSGAASPMTVAVSRNGNNVQLSFQTVNGAGYTVQFKNTLQDSSWQTLTTFTGDGAVDSKMDSIGSNVTRFYRVSANY